MKPVLAVVALGILVVGGLGALVLLRSPAVLPRLPYYTGEIGRYKLWVSVSDDPPNWVEAHGFDAGHLRLADGDTAVLLDVRAYVATYGNQVVVDFEPRTIGHLPPGARSQPLEGEPVEHRLSQSEVLAGASRVSVDFGRSGARPADRSYCSTTLTNHHGQPLRVVRFGGYFRTKGDLFELNNFTDRFFTSDDFIEWYAVQGPGGWLAPGGSVTDPNNWGGPDALWAFELETKTGERFWTGALYR
ncbi:MAG: hypothetical protein AAGA48_38555 [Myxococcota bacterium]